MKYDGITKTGRVVDKCEGCDDNHIDLSRALFQALGFSLDKGVIQGVTWYIS